MSKLNVGSTNNADVLNNLVGLTLKLFLQIFRDSQHRSCAEGITSMNANRVNVLNETDCYHVVVLVTNNFKLKFFPAKD